MKLQISDKLYEIVVDEVKEFVIIGISNEDGTYKMRQTDTPVRTEGFDVEIEYVDELIGSKFFTNIHHAYQYIMKGMLFERNTIQTREYFKLLIEPFLRKARARQGIYDVQVICNETNNPTIIEGKRFENKHT